MECHRRTMLSSAWEARGQPNPRPARVLAWRAIALRPVIEPDASRRARCAPSRAQVAVAESLLFTAAGGGCTRPRGRRVNGDHGGLDRRRRAVVALREGRERRPRRLRGARTRSRATEMWLWLPSGLLGSRSVGGLIGARAGSRARGHGFGTRPRLRPHDDRRSIRPRPGAGQEPDGNPLGRGSCSRRRISRLATQLFIRVGHVVIVVNAVSSYESPF